MNGATASLEGFARTGWLGPIELGATRDDILNLLGPPPDWYINLEGMGDAQGFDASPIWKYGHIELHFDGEVLWTIHADGCFGVPSAGPTLALDPWVVREGLPLEPLEAALTTAGIFYRAAPDPLNPECVKVETGAGTFFIVQVNGPSADLGLKVFGH